jgi:hypothetical protein
MKKAMADWFGVDPEHLPEFGPSLIIAPPTFQPVLRLSPESGEREISSSAALSQTVRDPRYKPRGSSKRLPKVPSGCA